MAESLPEIAQSFVAPILMGAFFNALLVRPVHPI